MNQTWMAFVVVVGASFGWLACTGETLPEEEAVGTSADELMRTPDGNLVLQPGDLADPGTGCFLSNPVCAVAPAAAHVAFTREDATLSSLRCAARAAEWSIYCGNPPSARTIANFQVHGRIASSTVHTPPNDTRCVVTLPACRRFPLSAGRFGDSDPGADVGPVRCGARAAEYHAWCGNLPGERVLTAFEVAGKPVDSWLFPK